MNIYLELHNDLEKACEGSDVEVGELLLILTDFLNSHREEAASLTQKAGVTTDFSVTELAILLIIEQILMLFTSHLRSIKNEEVAEAVEYIAVYKIEILRNILKKYSQEQENNS